MKHALLVVPRIFLALCPAFVAHLAFAEMPPLDESLAWKSLDGRDFHEVDFRHHKLSLTSFKRCDFHGVDFSGSDLDRTDFDDAKLSHTKGWGTVDFGMGISAHRANFQHADLSRARITGTYFEQADFRNANLREAILAGRFHEANFADADVRGAVLLGTSGIEPQLEELGRRGAIVTVKDWVKAVRDGRDFSNCEFDGVRMDGVNLDGVTLGKVDFRGSGFVGASFVKADLSGSRFSHAKLRGAKLMDVTAADTSWHGADLTGANCAHGVFANAQLASANLREADLTGADLTGADFSHADLTGANLAGAKLDGVCWENAIIADLRGIPPEQTAELKSRAGRWKYDLERLLDNLLTQASLPLWFLCCPLAMVCLIHGWVRRVNRWSYGLLAAIQLSALLLPVLMWSSLWPGMFAFAWFGLIAAIPVVLVAWILWWRGSPRSSPGALALATGLTGMSTLAAFGIFMQFLAAMG